MADEAFEAFWKMKGAPETVALHALFAGTAVPSEEMQKVLGLNLEQFNALLTVAGTFGLLEKNGGSVQFIAFQKDSAQSARLDWCLEGRKDELQRLVTAVKGTLLLRFLGSQPRGLS